MSEGRLREEMPLSCRSRTFLPAPLAVLEPLWLKFSQLGESFDPVPGSWDEVKEGPHHDVFRTIHRPRPSWTYHCEACRAGAHALELEVRICRGRSVIASLKSRESLLETGLQTAWDVEWSGEAGPGLAKLAWSRVATRLLRELAAEAQHREHQMIEAVSKTPWGRAEIARSEPLTPP